MINDKDAGLGNSMGMPREAWNTMRAKRVLRWNAYLISWRHPTPHHTHTKWRREKSLLPLTPDAITSPSPTHQRTPLGPSVTPRVFKARVGAALVHALRFVYLTNPIRLLSEPPRPLITRGHERGQEITEETEDKKNKMKNKKGRKKIMKEKQDQKEVEKVKEGRRKMKR